LARSPVVKRTRIDTLRGSVDFGRATTVSILASNAAEPLGSRGVP
jgi:hypothetical protein